MHFGNERFFRAVGGTMRGGSARRLDRLQGALVVDMGERLGV